MNGPHGRRRQDGMVNGFGPEIKAAEDDEADLRMFSVVKVLISLLPVSAAVDLVALSGVIGALSSFNTVPILDPCFTI